jgi:hypothetical protein
MTTCQNTYKTYDSKTSEWTACSGVASFIESEPCCEGETYVCSECVVYGGSTTSCEWAVMTLDLVVVASSDPSEIGKQY